LPIATTFPYVFPSSKRLYVLFGNEAQLCAKCSGLPLLKCLD
jgi:hypothetical protein